MSLLLSFGFLGFSCNHTIVRKVQLQQHRQRLLYVALMHLWGGGVRGGGNIWGALSSALLDTANVKNFV